MLQNIIILLILYAAMLISDGPKLKQKKGPARVAYGMLLLASFYLSLNFLVGKNWPNLDDLVKFLLADPAKSIVESVKLPS
ncbi:hypothetical protein [Ammoniphilus sp. 3BR4]|uniref:hypothetical protein n=1 Tax=Ammoniphilus sp. 3BR4 TaxID=3158265 RepID=UPI003465F58B